MSIATLTRSIGLLIVFASMPVAFMPAAFAQSKERDQWSTWRGPSDSGVAESQTPVTTWSKKENVLWSTRIPGRGHSTPIIVDDHIFLTTSDAKKETQSVICFDRSGGEILWNTVVNEGNFTRRIHPNNTHASPTVACDGKRVFALFNNNKQNQVTALDLEGNILWQRHVAKFKTQYPFGSGSTPILYDGLLYVPNETNAECAIICLDPETGKEVKRIDRGRFSSYSTPVIADVADKKQLLISGGSAVKGYDPDSGDELWSVPSKWQVSCGTMVWSGDMVYASGGFPAPQTLAINAREGTLVWEKPIKFYEQSMLVYDGRLYGLSDSGIIFCWDNETGEQLFKKRFEAPVSASPVLAGGNIYFTSEKGNTIVIKAGVDDFVEVARNKLGNSSFASFALADNRIYARVGFGQRGSIEEYLYCLGKE